MKRIGSFLALTALAAALLTSSGCQKKVEVQTGTRTVCTYGEPVSTDVKTISVPADKVRAYRVVTKTVTCDRHGKLEALYAAAQSDIAKGDLTAAKVKLTQIIATDSAFRRAQEQLSAIAAGKKPTPDTAGGGTSTRSKPTSPTATPGDDKPTGPALSLLRWAPDKLTGFTAAAPGVDAMVVSRQYTPQSGSKAESLVIVVEQFRSSEVAKAALDTLVKSGYPSDAAQPTINGHKAYYGTDGRGYAVVSFTQGAVLVEVEMSSKPGAQATLKDPIIAVAKQLP